MASHGDRTLDDFSRYVRDGLPDLIDVTVGQFPSRAWEDAEEFLAFSRGKLEKYVGLLAREEIDADDFEALVAGLGILAKLHALKAVGIARDDLERFRAGLLELTIDSAFRALGLSGGSGRA